MSFLGLMRFIVDMRCSLFPNLFFMVSAAVSSLTVNACKPAKFIFLCCNFARFNVPLFTSLFRALKTKKSFVKRKIFARALARAGLTVLRGFQLDFSVSKLGRIPDKLIAGIHFYNCCLLMPKI